MNYVNIVFPIIKRPEIPDPYKGERCCREPGICMREFCGLPRAEGSVLCEDHTGEVLRGEAKAPPLRCNIDYQSTMRKTFLVMDLPET